MTTQHQLNLVASKMNVSLEIEMVKLSPQIIMLLLDMKIVKKWLQ